MRSSEQCPVPQPKRKPLEKKKPRRGARASLQNPHGILLSGMEVSGIEPESGSGPQPRFYVRSSYFDVAPEDAHEQAASVAIDSEISPSPRVAWAKASQLDDASGGALAGSVLRRLSIGLFQAARASALSFALVGS